MKYRNILLLLMILVLVSGCGKKPPETVPVETEPTLQATEETLPQVEYGTAQINGIPAVLATMSRGDSVDIVGAFDGSHYTVKLDTGYGLVEKNLVRLEGEPAFEEWTGYAYRDAEVYDNYRLSGKPVKILKANEEVKVLDNLGGCCLVEHDGAAGYMKHESLAQKQDSSRGTSGSDKSAPGSGNGYVGEDGGEISLQNSGKLTLLSTITPQEGTVSGKAAVLADNTQIVLGYFDRGDKIPLLKGGGTEDTLTVYLDGLYAQVSGDYVHTEGETEYTPWEARSGNIAPVYSDIWMQGSPSDRVNANTAVTVLHELEDCYLVEINGVLGYMAKTDVISAETTPEPTKPEKEEKATEPTKPKEPSGSSQESTPEDTKPAESTPKETEPAETAPAKPEETEKPSTPEDSKDNNTGSENTEATSPEWTPPIL